VLDLEFKGVEALARKLGQPSTFVVVGPVDRRGRIPIVARRFDMVIKAKVNPPRPSERARQVFLAALMRTGADVVDQPDQARLLRSARRTFHRAKSAARLEV
jgi:hypothetical protein